MTNAQLYFAIGLPCFTILTSLVISLVSFLGVRESIKQIQEDLRDIRSDLKNIVGALNDLDKRVSIIEDRILGGSR